MLFGGAGESTKKPHPGRWKGEDNYGKKAFCLEVNNNMIISWLWFLGISAITQTNTYLMYIFIRFWQTHIRSEVYPSHGWHSANHEI